MKNTKNLFILSLSLFTLAACTPQSKEETAKKAAPFSAVNEKTATCEEQIVRKMKTHEIPLLSVAGLEKTITAANKLKEVSGKQVFKFTKVQEQIKTLEVSSEKTDESGDESFEYTLEPADSNSRFIMQLSIEASKKTKDSASNLNQTQGITEKCTLETLDTTYVKYTQTKPSEIAAQITKVYADGTNKPESYTLTVDPNLEFASFQTKYYEPNEDIPNKYTVQNAWGKRIVKTVLERVEGSKVYNEFGQTFTTKLFAIKMIDQDVLLLKGQIHYTPDGQYMMTYASGTTTWKVPETVFDQQRLGSPIAADYIKSKIDENYFQTNMGYDLNGMEKPSYQYFDAYMKLTSERMESDGSNTYTYTQGNGTFTAEPTAKDLATTDNIQTELPEIQAIAKKIRSQSSNRKKQIELILQYLKENYVYDWDLLKNNTLRPLTAEEALKRGKGVCQHYAVLFVTIARALKIPSVIVVGYSIGDGKPGGHAWVEVETSPKTWTVVEPQSKDGLTSTQSRGYFPLDRHTFLEDGKIEGMVTWQKFMTNIFTIKPVSH